MKEPAHVRWYVMTSVDFSYWGFLILLNESINELELVIIFRGKDYREVFVLERVFLYHGMGLDSTVLSHCVSAGQMIHELILDSTRVLCSFEMEWMSCHPGALGKLVLICFLDL